MDADKNGQAVNQDVQGIKKEIEKQSIKNFLYVVHARGKPGINLTIEIN